MFDINLMTEIRDFLPFTDAIAHTEKTPYSYWIGQYENVTFPEKMDVVADPISYNSDGDITSACFRHETEIYRLSYDTESESGCVYGVKILSLVQQTFEEITNKFVALTGANKYVRPQRQGSTRLDVLDLKPMIGLCTERKDLRVRSLNFDFYNEGTEEAFKGLCREIPKGGIHVLHGPPGTGKTSFITALAQELDNGVRFVYPKIDPSIDLEAIVSYLKDAYRSHVCLIVENGEEIFDKATQAMLNVGDGILSLLGKYNVSILITSNREGDDIIDNIHEAMSRKGRMRSFVNLPFYTEDKAHDLLFKYELPELPVSLADLYAMLEEKDSPVLDSPAPVKSDTVTIEWDDEDY